MPNRLDVDTLKDCCQPSVCLPRRASNNRRVKHVNRFAVSYLVEHRRPRKHEVCVCIQDFAQRRRLPVDPGIPTDIGMAPAFCDRTTRHAEYSTDHDACQREYAFGHGRMVSRYTPAF